MCFSGATGPSRPKATWTGPPTASRFPANFRILHRVPPFVVGTLNGAPTPTVRILLLPARCRLGSGVPAVWRHPAGLRPLRSVGGFGRGQRRAWREEVQRRAGPALKRLIEYDADPVEVELSSWQEIRLPWSSTVPSGARPGSTSDANGG